MLIRPLEGDIKDKSLIIIPDGILTRLPFEAIVLREKEKDYTAHFITSNSIETLRSELNGKKFLFLFL
jgi:predicted methyltransferase MtxX (methanogen marker protein 4)